MADYTLGLTAAEIDAVLQGVDDGSLIPAINKIKTSQFVVEGTTGDPLPSTTPTGYLVGAEMAFGWVVTTDVVDAVIDANGNLTATSGVVEYTFDKADNETPNSASLFASVMRCTDAANSVYVQDYADGSNGISITETTTTVTMVIDFSDFAGGKVFGTSEQLGRLSIDSTSDIEQSLIEEGFVRASVSGGVVTILESLLTASVTRNLAGDFTVMTERSLYTDNPSVVGSAGSAGGSAIRSVTVYPSTTADNIQFSVLNAADNKVDPDTFSLEFKCRRP